MANESFLIGLIGAGIQGSLSPALHEAEAAALGKKLIYKLIDLTALGLNAAALPDLLFAAERLGFTGLNITFPCKQLVIPYLTDLSAEARTLGAVNTVVFGPGTRTGHNTDAPGFATNFRENLPNAPRRNVLQIGAGGAGAAVAHALLAEGVHHLIISDTNPIRAADLAQALNMHFGHRRATTTTALNEAMAEADGLVNCTPVGMAKFPGCPVPINLLRANMWVADIIYFPLETELLAAARHAGCQTLPGTGMTVHQAAHAFTHFTGLAPNAARMSAHMAALVRVG